MAEKVLNKKGACIYRHPEAINCEDHSKCDTCGWNPEVERKRIAEEFRRRVRKNFIKCH